MALKANELRIGNIIRVGGSTLDTYQTFKPKIVTIDILNAIQEENDERPDAFLSVWMPIELTPEILEAAGFSNDESDSAFVSVGGDKGIIYYHDMFNPLDLCVFEGGEIFVISGDFVASQPLKHLHQLQNLFFALTGQELEIKLPQQA